MQNRTPAEMLLDLMTALEYKTSKKPCIGLSMMAINAFFSGELTVYLKRLILIKHTTDLDKKIAALKEKVKTHQALSEEEKFYLTIPTFLEDIFAILHPEKLSLVLGKEVFHYQYQTIFTGIGSEKLSQAGGLRAPKAWIGIYTKNELNDLLQLLEQSELKDNLALTLDDDVHEVALCYDAKDKQWIVIDTITLTATPATSQQVASEIFKAFGHKNAPIVLTTNLFATKQTEKAVKDSAEKIERSQKFVDLHKITQQKAQAKTEFNVSLLQLAARMGFATTVKDLIAAGAKADEQMLMLAAQNGHSDVIKALQGKVNFNSANANGATPVYIAAQVGHAKTIRALAKRGADVNLGRKDGWKPIIIAAKQGKAKAVRALAKSGANIACTNEAGKSAADFAIEQDDVKVLRVLAEHNSIPAQQHLQTKFNLFQPGTKAPLVMPRPKMTL